MFLSKRENGTYYLIYTNSEGKRKKVSAKTKNKSEANKFLANFVQELASSREVKTTPISLFSFTMEFLKHSEVVHTDWTHYTYKQTFGFFKEFFGDIALIDLTAKDINRYVEYRIKRASVYQARKDLINICAAFNWAVNEGYLIKSPGADVKKVKVPQKLPIFYSEKDFAELLSVIDSEDIRDITIFAINTGLRQMELLKLEWKQIDFKEKIVILDNQMHITKGKKVRMVPLNKNALDIIEKREKSKTCFNVFTYNGLEMNQDFFSHKFASYVKKANINQKLNFHSLRHTFASWLVQKGVSIYKVSKLLGHSDTKTTEIYSHLRAEDLKESTDLLTD